MAKMVKMRAIGGRADGQTFELPHGTVMYFHREEITPLATAEHAYRVFELAGINTKITFLAPAGWTVDNLLGHVMTRWQPGPPPVGF